MKPEQGVGGSPELRSCTPSLAHWSICAQEPWGAGEGVAIVTAHTEGTHMALGRAEGRDTRAEH